MKKITISLLIIGVVAVAAIGGTLALFSDTETSTGNILTAGELDLKVDHVRQTYNDLDCKTCSVEVYSSANTGDMVIERNGVALTSYPAVLAWTHSNWMTAHVFDPSDKAKWIWEHNPTRSPEDTQTNTSYSFQKTFEWMGPVTGATLDLALGSDNMYVVYLNGNQIGQDLSENNFSSPDHITNIPANYFNQGTNVLKFVITNKGVAGSTAYSNPAGLIYKFTINGQCGSDYFKTHCTLWGEKDLAPGDKFFNLNDVKPGDHGTNIISLHLYDNPGWACLFAHDKIDTENDLVDPEEEAGDVTTDVGELSQNMEVVLWKDVNADKAYNANEPILYEGNLSPNVIKMKVADSSTPEPLQATTTYYIGLAWCLGDQTVDQGQGTILCNGASASNQAQTDSLSAALTLYTEQYRHNESFDCSQVVWPLPVPTP